MSKIAFGFENPADVSYLDVAAHVISRAESMTRNQIIEAFPGVSRRKMSNCIENACSRGYIKSVRRGVYASSGRLPNQIKTCGTQIREPGFARIDTTDVVSAALKARSAIEGAWMAIACSRVAEPANHEPQQAFLF